MKVENFYNHGSYYEFKGCNNVNISISKNGIEVNGKKIEEYKQEDDLQTEEEGESSPVLLAKKSKTRPLGRTPEPLFKDRRGRKDEKTTQEKVEAFIAHLKVNDLCDTPIDTSKENAVNKAFVCFYREWMDENTVMTQPNGNACFRFLHDDCGLTLEKGIKTYANFIREMIVNS